MSRDCRLIRLFILAVIATLAAYAQSGGDDILWHEFGLVQQTSGKIGTAQAAIFRMKDVTGALAAWEWKRSPASKACSLEPFCSAEGKRTVVASANYVLVIDGAVAKVPLDAFIKALPNRRDASLPALLTFVPRKNLVANSARYVLGPESLKAFAPQLVAAQPGFEQGAEAEVASYNRGANNPLRLAIFYYPTPEMARLHLPDFKRLPGVQAKRSSVLVAVIFGAASEQDANSLLGQIGYEANITWNDIPPPSPIKPLYQLLRNIIFLSIVLSALCFVSGLIYAGIRLYRRKFGTLEDEEAMTSLHLSGE